MTPGIDIAFDAGMGFLGHQRSEVGVVTGRIRRNLQVFDPRRQLFHQPVGGILADGHRNRNRHAALAGRAVTGTDQRIDRLIQVGVRHDDHVVFGAAKTLNALCRRRSRANRHIRQSAWNRQNRRRMISS